MCETRSVERYIGEYTETYLERIYYFSLKRTSDPQNAEDLTSDITLAVLTQLHSGNFPEKFHAWVWTIARNRYSKWAAKKRIQADNICSEDVGDIEAAETVTPEDELLKSEELSLLRRELAFISSEYRNIVVPYYIGNLSLRSIAGSLNITENAAKTRLFRARKILKEGMDMAREFGTKSYNPEEIEFIATGDQPSSLPWSAVQRKASKNILLEASNNPSTVEDLSTEIGIAAPYMEEEVELLVNATLLKKVGNKYVTNFYIFDRAAQEATYKARKEASPAISALIDRIADDLIPTVRATGADRNGMSDNEIKWWLVPHIVDLFCKKHNNYVKKPRENGETWGFVGYEKSDIPEIFVGYNGVGCDETSFRMYQIDGYGMAKRGEMPCYHEVLLLGNAIREGKQYGSFTTSEKNIGLNKKLAHADAEGNIIPHLLVFENDAIKNLIDPVITSHTCYNELAQEISSVHRKISSILDRVAQCDAELCIAMEMTKMRAATVCDEVENGRLKVPDDIENSTAAMYLLLR